MRRATITGRSGGGNSNSGGGNSNSGSEGSLGLTPLQQASKGHSDVETTLGTSRTRHLRIML
jgi:hypothetical protein